MCSQYSHTPLQLLIKRLMVVSVGATFAMGAAQANEILPDDCTLYGVNDAGLNDSQVITIGGSPLSAATLGEMYAAHDLEGMDLCPNGKLYLSSGDDSTDGNSAGHLYEMNTTTGGLTSIGDITFDLKGTKVSGREVSAISCRQDGTLWGWAEECGLVRIDPVTGNSTLELQYADDATCLTPDPASYTSYVEDMTWDMTGRVIYYPLDNKIFSYDPSTKKTLEIATLDRNVEATEMLPNGNLLVGLHGSHSLLELKLAPSINKSTAVSDKVSHALVPSPYNDIEALTWSCSLGEVRDCAANQWTYVKDNASDGTGTGPILNLDGVQVATGVNYEIYGVAIREDGDRVTVAMNARMGLRGEDLNSPQAVDGNIAWSDFVFDMVTKDAAGNFTGSNAKYAVHFSPGSDSGVTELGLYKNITLKDVTQENYGWTSMSSYNRGDLGNLPKINGYFSSIYSKSRSVPMSIATGTKVADDGFRLLSPEELKAMKLDFAKGLAMQANKLGEYTFGFSFKKQADMQGNFVAYVFTECTNDGVAIVNHLPLATTSACN
jgi:hypothetical protein